MKYGKRLTGEQIAKLKEDGRYFDGKGLYLQIVGNARSFLLRYEKDGQAHWMGIGSARVVSLKEARLRAKKAHLLLLDGIDPLDARKASRNDAERDRMIAEVNKVIADCKILDAAPLKRMKIQKAKQVTEIRTRSLQRVEHIIETLRFKHGSVDLSESAKTWLARQRDVKDEPAPRDVLPATIKRQAAHAARCAREPGYQEKCDARNRARIVQNRALLKVVRKRQYELGIPGAKEIRSTCVECGKPLVGRQIKLCSNKRCESQHYAKKKTKPPAVARPLRHVEMTSEQRQRRTCAAEQAAADRLDLSRMLAMTPSPSFDAMRAKYQARNTPRDPLQHVELSPPEKE
jgi:Arm DNA-binding domain